MKFFIILTISLFSMTILAFSEVLVASNVYGVGSGLNNQRTIVRDSAGNLYIAYSGYDGANYQIYIAFSSDDGATWNPTWATITSNTYDDIQPTLAIDSNDTLHIVWMGNMTSAGGNDADLMYRKYPGGTNTAICTYSSYPGAHCPSMAVGPDDDVYVAYTGCPSSWEVRYLHYDRTTDTWDAPENIGVMTPSRFPSIEVDSLNQPHILYRNTFGSNYRLAHRMKIGGVWHGFNGANRDTVDIFTTASSKTEHTSLYIDTRNNVHCVWDWNENFGANPDTVRYRKYDTGTSSWGAEMWLWGNGIADAHITYSGDVVVDETGNVYVFYHDNDSVFVAISHDNGLTFPIDSVLTHISRCRYPNARGSKYPLFNRVYDDCIDFVYTWYSADSSMSYLMFDNLCGIASETTSVCANFIEPAESSITSCSDQQISLGIGCCGDTVVIHSDSMSVEFFDSSISDWRPVYEVSHSQGHSPADSLDTLLSHWIWSEPGPSFASDHDDWFRVFIHYDYPCTNPDSAVITIHCDNKAYIYVNNDSCFNPAYYDTWVDTTNGGSLATYWWRLYCFNDIVDYLHGGVDTIYIRGHNISSIAGLQFQILVRCSNCCGAIDTNSIQFTVNSSTYTISNPELSWDDDSILTFTPIAPDTFENNDTITACLIAAEDTCTGSLDSTICKIFFVDLQPPVIMNIYPPPDTTISDTLPTISFELLDSFSGLDTSTIVFMVDSILDTSAICWAGSTWALNWTPDFAFSRGDTIQICVSATDSTAYCDDNVLDTCWNIYIEACAPASVWIICPADTCGFLSACENQAIIFGMWDSTGVEIDTHRVYYSAIVHHLSGTTDTIVPTAIFTSYGDTIAAEFFSTWWDNDSVTIILDSLFTTDGCKTIP
ncbi:hypothetical protein J7L68_09675 [bacterium]|nr:hypothetical protein [bacterium]